MWADEEEPQWGADDSETQPAGDAAPAAAAGGEGGEGAPPAEGGEGAPAGDQPVEEEKKKRDANRPVYFRYDVRIKIWGMGAKCSLYFLSQFGYLNHLSFILFSKCLKISFRHWVRPKFLQYSYIYDYRKNYYDDVLDYLDRRSHGITREPPRPQTWAERALRTYTQKLGKTENAIKIKSDEELIHSVHHARAIHHVHSKNYYSRKLTTAY